jgi:predicted nuclease of predicted toxin-antitoxin system
MYPATVAEQLWAKTYDVVSIHDPEYRRLGGASDAEVFAAALAEERALVTENVSDFRRLESEALARGERPPSLIFTTNRQFPRGDPRTVGRLVLTLEALLAEHATLPTAIFLKPRSG